MVENYTNVNASNGTLLVSFINLSVFVATAVMAQLIHAMSIHSLITRFQELRTKFSNAALDVAAAVNYFYVYLWFVFLSSAIQSLHAHVTK